MRLAESKLCKKGSILRNTARFEEHNYKKSTKSISWTEKRLKDFLDMHESMIDWQLAKKFKTTIPSIQGVRRKINLAKRILEDKSKRPTKPAILKLIVQAESVLRNMIKENAKKKK